VESGLIVGRTGLEYNRAKATSRNSRPRRLLNGPSLIGSLANRRGQAETQAGLVLREFFFGTKKTNWELGAQSLASVSFLLLTERYEKERHVALHFLSLHFGLLLSSYILLHIIKGWIPFG
jgi:hypothetical protein